jgi:hypothetical protein
MYFYELHEGDDEIFGDLLLAHDERFEPDEFFEMVQRIRRRVQDDFPHDTLIEAIAEGLEDEYGFTPLDDDELTASVHVSTIDEENELTPTGTLPPEPEWGEDDEDVDAGDGNDGLADLDELPDYVTITAELQGDRGPRPH